MKKIAVENLLAYSLSRAWCKLLDPSVSKDLVFIIIIIIIIIIIHDRFMTFSCDFAFL